MLSLRLSHKTSSRQYALFFTTSVTKLLHFTFVNKDGKIFVNGVWPLHWVLPHTSRWILCLPIGLSIGPLPDLNPLYFRRLFPDHLEIKPRCFIYDLIHHLVSENLPVISVNFSIWTLIILDHLSSLLSIPDKKGARPCYS